MSVVHAAAVKMGFLEMRRRDQVFEEKERKNDHHSCSCSVIKTGVLSLARLTAKMPGDVGVDGVFETHHLIDAINSTDTSGLCFESCSLKSSNNNNVPGLMKLAMLGQRFSTCRSKTEVTCDMRHLWSIKTTEGHAS